MSYFSSMEDGASLDGLGCGPACNCGPCKSGLSGLSEWYEKEEERPAATRVRPPQRSSSAEPLNGWNGPRLLQGYYGSPSDGLFAEASAPPRLHPRCGSLDLTVPNTYAALEEAVRRWISTCVMSRTEVRPGVPIRQERELVNGNPSLRGIWDRILQQLKGKRVKIVAAYTWGPHHVQSITFSTTASPPPPPPTPRPPAPVRVPCPPPTCTPAPPFVPSRHGFNFDNDFSVTIRLPSPFPPITRKYGLCGGMASAALDYFLSCIPIPSTTTVPAIGSPLYNYLMSRLLDSLGSPSFGMVKKVLWWTQRPDVTSRLSAAAAEAVGQRAARVLRPAAVVVLGPVAAGAATLVTVDGVQELTVPEFHATVASLVNGRMVVLCLIYQGPGALDIWENHQVLAHGISRVSSTVTDIKVYDPNYNRDDSGLIRCELLAGGTRVRCMHMKSGLNLRKVRGFFRMPYIRRTPPCLP